jgi:hypothetical protein
MRFAPGSVRAAVLQRCWLVALPAGLAVYGLGCSSSDAGFTPTSGGNGGSGISAGGSGSTPVTSSGSPSVVPGAGGTGSNPVGQAGSAPTSAGTGTGGSSVASGGASASAGAGGGGNTTGGDTPAMRPLMVNAAAAANKQISFSAKQLDPMAGTAMVDTHAGDQEYGQVDTRKKVQGKLVMTLGGIGGCCGQGGIGGFAVGLGFHHLAIAMQTAISSAPDEFKKVPEAARTDEENRQMGDGRMEAWDGVDRVKWLDIGLHDSFAYRAQLGLKYMQEQDPGGDWAYFTNADGSVRWSDVYLVGYSYGSQTLAVVAKYVRIGRGIATSGPENEGFPNATWIKKESATPLDRMYGLFGSTNLGDKVETTQAAGWLGDALTVNGGAAAGSFGMSHLLILTGQGHSEFCAGDGGDWKALCNYAFGVTP